MRDIIFPASLKPGDTIAIIAPASVVKREYIDGAISYIRQRGFNPIEMPGVSGPVMGSYSASIEQRLSDLHAALRNNEVKAILCARGGYGCVHLLRHISISEVASHPKWLIGFSDVSALHALWHKAGVASIHGPMAKHLATKGDDDPYSQALINSLCSEGEFDIAMPTDSRSFTGEAEGILRGGNFAVLNSLGGTPHDILDIGDGEDVILFFEDIGEAIYEVERMLVRLCLNGSLFKAKGVIFGQFTEYRTDLNFKNMEEMISNFLKTHNLGHIPIAINFPVGHVDSNFPLTEGAQVKLEITPVYTRLHKI